MGIEFESHGGTGDGIRWALRSVKEQRKKSSKESLLLKAHHIYCHLNSPLLNAAKGHSNGYYAYLKNAGQ